MTVRLYRGILLALLPAIVLISCSKSATNGAEGGDSTAATMGSSGGDVVAANVAVSRDFIEKALNNGDTAFAREHIDPSFVEHNPMPGQKADINGFFEWLAMQKSAFPDTKITIDDIFGQGDMVCIRSTMTGTNTGEMMGQPATGKSVNVEGIDIIKIKDGKMTDHWGQIDAMKMMQQLGLMPENGAGGAPASGEAKSDTAG
jgi:steroid delta-isomerase-like uncharacterized protein